MIDLQHIADHAGDNNFVICRNPEIIVWRDTGNPYFRIVWGSDRYGHWFKLMSFWTLWVRIRK